MNNIDAKASNLNAQRQKLERWYKLPFLVRWLLVALKKRLKRGVEFVDLGREFRGVFYFYNYIQVRNRLDFQLQEQIYRQIRRQFYTQLHEQLNWQLCWPLCDQLHRQLHMHIQEQLKEDLNG